MTKRKNNRYTPEYKEKAVKLAKSLGNASQAARNLGISVGVLNLWIKKDKERPNQEIGLAKHLVLESENRDLKKENERLKMELEITKKAAAYFAAEELKKSTPRSKR